MQSQLSQGGSSIRGGTSSSLIRILALQLVTLSDHGCKRGASSSISPSSLWWIVVSGTIASAPKTCQDLCLCPT